MTVTREPRRPPTVARRRWVVGLALAAVIAAGVASRTVGAGVPGIGKELGGVLWAVMFYLIVAFSFPRLPPAGVAAAAFGFAAGTEALQLYKAPWIEAVRANRIGGLVLGHSFAWRDVGCYVVGTLAAWALDAGRARAAGRRLRGGRAAAGGRLPT